MTKSNHTNIDMINSVPSEIIPQPDMPSKPMPIKPDGERQSLLDQVVNYAKDQNELFHDCKNICYARNLETHETLRIESKLFRQSLIAAYYREKRKSIKKNDVNEAIETLTALALFEGVERSVSLKIAQQNGRYYVDLCEPGKNRAVEWSAEGWRVVENHDILFVRSEFMRPLPVPVANGSLDPLWENCNIHATDRLLVLAWIIDALRIDTPFPGLEVTGVSGSGKSTVCESLRRIIDPSSLNLRGAPKSTEDIFVYAGMNHLVTYENLSYLSGPMQDVMCVLSTGGGFGKRKLFTDFDESVLIVQRPWLVNGINPTVTAPDLLNRAVCIECPVIQSRIATNEQRAKFERDLPVILGGLFDVASAALSQLPAIDLKADDRPRMIEYCTLGMAISRITHQNDRHFLNLYTDNLRESVTRIIDSSPVCTAIIDALEHHEEINASVKQIMHILEQHRPERCHSWPKSEKGLGEALRRSATALGQLGIECYSLGKQGGLVRWLIKKKLAAIQEP